jgi:hypothetical protein
MPFQPGNQEAKKADLRRPRIVAQAIISALRETDSDNIPKLHRLAHALVAKALDGDVAAMKEVADRVDGRVPVQVQGDPDNPLVIATVMREIVDPTQRPNAWALPDASDPRAA